MRKSNKETKNNYRAMTQKEGEEKIIYVDRYI